MVRGEPGESPSERTIQRGEPGESPRPRAPLRPVVTIGLAVAAVVLVGPRGDRRSRAAGDRGIRRLAPRSATVRRRSSSRPTRRGRRRAVPDGSRSPGASVLAMLAQTVVIVVGLTLLWCIGRALLQLARRIPEPPDLPPEEHWPEPAAEMVDAVDEGLAALTAGPVDEVIIECWVRLEAAAAAAGRGPRRGGDVGRAGQPRARRPPRPGGRRRRAAAALPPGPLLAPHVGRARPRRRRARPGGHPRRASPEPHA